MNKPKEKWWRTTDNDVGGELGNPAYILWADERIATLEKELAKFTSTNSDYVAALSCIHLYRQVTPVGGREIANFKQWCEQRINSAKPNCT